MGVFCSIEIYFLPVVFWALCLFDYLPTGVSVVPTPLSVSIVPTGIPVGEGEHPVPTYMRHAPVPLT